MAVYDLLVRNGLDGVFVQVPLFRCPAAFWTGERRGHKSSALPRIREKRDIVNTGRHAEGCALPLPVPYSEKKSPCHALVLTG
jgi:hypothetical protein